MRERLTVALNKARALFTRSTRERDMDEELRFHVDMEAADLRRAGVPADEALRRARASFGGIERTKDDARDAAGWRWIDDLARDVQYAQRQLWANPGFTAATLLTLALGIGATTTMYTIDRALAAAPIHIPHHDDIVHVAQGMRGECIACGRLATGNYVTVRDEARTLAGAALFSGGSVILRGPERAELVQAASVTPALFQTLGIPAMLGRTLIAADTAADGRHAVVLNEGLWRTRFGADSNIVNKTIVIDGIPCVVVGVIANEYAFPRGTKLWAPRALDAAAASDRLWTNDEVVARLVPGATLVQARAELATLGGRIATTFPEAMAGWTFDAMSFDEWQAPRTNEQATALSVAVVLLLMIACVNLAGLLLARLAARQKEIAVRAAMGATGSRVARQLLTEVVLLTVVSGLVAALIAAGALVVIRSALPSSIAESLPGWRTMHADVRAFVAAVVTGALTGLLIGVWPAWRFGRPVLAAVMKDSAWNATSTGRASQARRGLVIVEVALAIVLLTAASLVARSVRNLAAVDPGFRVDHLLTLQMTTPPHVENGHARLDSLALDRLVDQVTAVRAVVSAAAVYGMPYSYTASTTPFTIEGQSNRTEYPSVRIVPVTPDYFQTLAIPVLSGRTFARSDSPSAPRVAMIDETVARRVFGAGNPIGHFVLIDSTRWEIVGVVADTRYNARGRTIAQAPGELYRPMAQAPKRYSQLIVRTTGDPADIVRDVTDIIREIDPDIAVTRIRSMQSLLDDDVVHDRVTAGLMLWFASVAALIAAIGLYGVISYGVAQRTREFGIRRALGAGSSSLLALVMRQGMWLAMGGAAVGIIGALAIARLLGSTLFGISPTDPATFAAVVVGMCAVGIAAAYLPARRAMRIDPMTALREE